MKKVLYSFLGMSLFTPLVSFAQGTANGTHLMSILKLALRVVNILGPIVFGLLFVAILWKAYQLMHSDGEEKAQYKSELIKSVVILFVVLSLYGIIFFVGRTLGIGQYGGGQPICPVGHWDPTQQECI